jgi:hypothetical protein
MTKEEMIVKITTLDQSNQFYAKEDERIRKEFAKAFHWTKRKSSYDYEDEILKPTWEEVLIEVGKLLERKKRDDVQEKLGELSQRLMAFEIERERELQNRNEK